jgi:uncharacterized protein
VRVFLDSNVLIAAFIARGACAHLMQHAIRHHRILTTLFVLAEVEDRLSSKFSYSPTEVRGVGEFLTVNCELVAHGSPEEALCRDPDDDNVLAGALVGEADCIVTGDKDLLVLGEVKGIPILAPADFWQFECGRRV